MNEPRTSKTVLEIFKRDSPTMPWGLRVRRIDAEGHYELMYSPHPIEVRHPDEPREGASKERVNEVLAFLGELMCDFVDREKTDKADMIGTAINLIVDGRPADEPPVMLVDGPISASTTVLDVLRSVDNLLEQNRYEPESSTRHQLAIAMSMLRPAEPPPAIRSESVDFLQALFFDSFNVKMSRENCRSILVEALGQPETKTAVCSSFVAPFPESICDRCGHDQRAHETSGGRDVDG